MENNEQLIDMNERVRILGSHIKKNPCARKRNLSVMGVSLEERIEFLLARDLAKEMKKAWFKKVIAREADE